MRFILPASLCVAVLAFTHPASAQQQDSEVVTVGADKFLRWYGHPGRTYFIEVSDPNHHLNKWTWAPIIESGNDENISYEVDGTADKGFFRLWISDLPTNDPDGSDFDSDGLTNWNEVSVHQTNPIKADSDGDYLPDSWEIEHGLDPNDDGSTDEVNGGFGDPDGDGLVNAYEFSHLASPNLTDTDGDGLEDLEEVATFGTYPFESDTDQDGLDDYAEVVTYGSDPWSQDTDEDTLLDGDEVHTHYSSPLEMDTDGDWMWDAYEVNNNLDPAEAADGLLDADGDSLANQLEFVFLDQGFNPFIGNNAAIFPWAGDPDNDDLSTQVEYVVHLTHPRQHDTDLDGLPDGWEVQHGLNAKNSSDANGTNADPDIDGLGNFDEWLNGCNPTDFDTDDDGTDDFTEVNQGSDPNDPDDQGDPPPAQEMLEVPFTVGDPSESHSEKWKLTVRGLGPEDERVLTLASPSFGQMASTAFLLRKGNRYEISVSHLGTDPEHLAKGNSPDYDWEAKADDKPDGISEESVAGIVGVNNYFVVQGHWIADNRQAVLTAEKHGNLFDIVTGRTAMLVPALQRDEDVIDNDWRPLAGNLSKALPGQKINLRFNPTALGYGFSLAEPKWSLSSKIFRDYIANVETATLSEIEETDLSLPAVGFYFTDSGIKNITLDIKVNGVPMQIFDRINILEPSSSFTTTLGEVRFDNTLLHLSLGLHYNTNTSPLGGLGMFGSVQVPEGESQGIWHWVQLATVERSKIDLNGDFFEFSLNGQKGLDTNYGYSPDYPTSGQQRATSDSPAMLCTGWQCVNASDEFELYQMFRPSGTESRFVPLRKVVWGWNGYGVKGDDGSWSFTTQSPAYSSNSEKTSVHPEWEINLKDGEMAMP